MIHISGLNFSYPDKKLFNTLTFNLDNNGICGLLGRNGAGKTTLLNILSGKIFPHSGSSTILGYNSAQRNVAMLSNLYYLPEDVYLPEISGHEYRNIIGRFYPKFDRSYFHRLLDQLDIMLDSKLSRLSHGQKKKFAMAFALATRSQIILMDEPTNGLDIPSKSIIREILDEPLSRESLIVISTHQIKDIESVLDHILIIDSGKLLFDMTRKDLLNRFSFTTKNEEPDSNNDDIIFFQKDGYLYRCLTYSKEYSGCDLDVELLFNAAIHHPDKLKEESND